MSHEAGPPGSAEPSDRRSDEDPGPLARIDAGMADRGWEYDDYPVADEDSAVEPPPGPAGWQFLTAAVRRRAVAVCISGVVGLFLGAGLLTVKPPTYKATVSGHPDPEPRPGRARRHGDPGRPGPDPCGRRSGGQKELGLTQSIPGFLGSYTSPRSPAGC